MATTQISRYRPAVLALTGTAAAYGTYLVYTAFANQPANEGLRRSNAIHHQSRPSRLTIECVHLDDEAVLGKIVFRKGSTRYEVDIYKSGVPLVQDVAERFPSVPAEQYTIELLQQKTAQCVFEACNSGLTDSERYVEVSVAVLAALAAL